jgi:hypothetical protein
MAAFVPFLDKRRKDHPMTAEPPGNAAGLSVESLAEVRSEAEEFGEIMDLLRSSPRAQGLSPAELEQRARAAWSRFTQAPVRTFVPILVERAVLGELPATA